MKGHYCSFCGNNVRNPCIHDSQVKWCKQKAIMSAEEVYGAYETSSMGVVVEKGTGPIRVLNPIFTDDFVSFEYDNTTTKVRLSSISL